MTYVDDIIAISEDSKGILQELVKGDSKIKFKNEQIKPPEIYLVAKLTKKKMDGIER